MFLTCTVLVFALHILLIVVLRRCHFLFCFTVDCTVSLSFFFFFFCCSQNCVVVTFYFALLLTLFWRCRFLLLLFCCCYEAHPSVLS